MLRIAGGRVYDPANGIAGEERDVCVQDGRIVADVPAHARTINAGGMVVMPGGVDIHAHIAGPAVNAARKLSPEEHRADVVERTAIMRSGTGGTVPSTFTTGYRYALLGYTTVVEAATPPLAARHTLSEIRDTPVIDAAFLVLMGNNLPLFELIRSEPARVREAIAWYLQATGGYGVKLVNPGGVEMWKRGNGNVTSLDDEGPGVTPRQVIETIAGAVHDLGLPHPVHVHCNNLGVSGNYRTTLDTLDTLQGRRAHLAHLQFHAYGGKPGGRPRSRAPELAEYLGAHPELSADVGQVMFGPAMTMTADAPVSAVLAEITHGKWVNADTEAETGCGIVPFTYREKNYVHALQWGIGLELFLLSRDPWRLVLSTDHPNGGSFLSYPRLIRLLMDREFRNEQIRRVNRAAMKRTVLLDDLDREYTLEEIAIITRAGPARLLGLSDKGHLGVGADADITVYVDDEDREAMFAAPRHVIKDGHHVVEDGELRETGAGPAAAGRRRVRREHRADAGEAVRGPLQRPVLELSGERAVAARAREDGGRGMKLHGAEIVDTFAEAFPMWGSRVVITAATPEWALEAGRSMTGFATSVIGCKCEAAIERVLEDTPDGRPGVSVLLFAMDKEGVGKRLVERVGQCVLTSPTAACFNGLEAEDTVDVGGQLRYFGDGYQASKVLDGERYWRVPVMEGEFLVQERFGVVEGVAGGNIIMLGRDVESALRASEAAASAMRSVEGVIMPFPGGIARSGSKVGSRYGALPASTNHVLCPTLRGQVDDSDVPPDVEAVFEIVIDGLALEPVREAMRVGLVAAAEAGASHVTAGNYGGNLGPHHIHLRELV